MLSEATFHTAVVQPRLEALFGVDAVEHEKYLGTTGSFADYWVDLDLFVLAIEVENDADSVRSGVAQALEYAQNDDRALPAVITPEGCVDEAQADQLRDICPIVELPIPADVDAAES